jgi:hypothetical protein
MERFRAFLERNEVLMDFYHKVVAASFNIIIAIVVASVAYHYYDRQLKAQNANARLERTLKTLTGGAADEPQRKAMFEKFPDRWKVPIGKPLSYDDAVAYRDTCTRPWENEALCAKWDVARKHLNELEPVAFAYVHDFADSEILAAAMCVYMVRSFRYFEQLILALRELYGPGHTWQVIKQAVTSMQQKHGEECKDLQRALDAKQAALK